MRKTNLIVEDLSCLILENTFKRAVLFWVWGSQSLRSLSCHKGSSWLQSPNRWSKDFSWMLHRAQWLKGKIFLFARVPLTPRLLWQIFLMKILNFGGIYIEFSNPTIRPFFLIRREIVGYPVSWFDHKQIKSEGLGPHIGSSRIG